MKNKIIKAVMALSLSLAAAIPSAAFSAQAAETDIAATGDTHVHSYTVSLPYVIYEEANSLYHWKIVQKDYNCTKCIFGYTEELSIEYQEHDLSGYSNGKLYCVDCGYEE